MFVQKHVRAFICLCLPNIVVFLNVDLVEHHIFLLGTDISLHLHGNVMWQHRQQQALLRER